MKTTVYSILVIGLVHLSTPTVWAQAAEVAPSANAPVGLTDGERDTIFVGETKVQPSVSDLANKGGHGLALQRAVEALDTQFITELSATNVFQLVERKRVADVTNEQDFTQMSGRVASNSAGAAQIGQIAGAKFAFLPQIDAFEMRSTSTKYERIGRNSSSRSIYMSAIVQIIDTTTGKILPDVPSVQLSTSEGVELARMGTVAGSDQAVVKLAHDMANKLSQGVVALLRPAKVLTITGNQIMINRGAAAGFEPGKKVQFFATEKVKDEDSGETYTNEIQVGSGVIERGDPKKSFAKAEGDDLGIAKGCVVKLATETKKPARSAGSGKKAEEELSPGSSDKPLNF